MECASLRTATSIVVLSVISLHDHSCHELVEATVEDDRL